MSTMGKIHILLADDDQDDRFFFKEALDGAAIDAALITVENGQELTDLLLDILVPPPPDIIFLDINMPLKNGKICLKEIRKEAKFDRVPVVMFSTSFHKKDIEETFSDGANLYIFKSVFFENETKLLDLLFSSNWKKKLATPSKENYVLKIGLTDN